MDALMIINQSGERQFTGKKDDWDAAVKLAENCQEFAEDVEEELVADQLRSCYNCRFRRWTSASFICRK